MDTSTNYSQDQSMKTAMSPFNSDSADVNVSTPERIISTAAGAGALLAAFGMKQANTTARVASALAASMLLYRGLTGHCPVNSAIGRNTADEHDELSSKVIKSVTILRKSRQEVYSFWRKLENLPQFMSHIKEVKQLDSTRSLWKANIPGGLGSVEWEAKIIADTDSHIAWQSLPGSTVENNGEVRFKDVPGGVEVQASISYRAPAGDLGGMVAKWLNPSLSKMVKEDMNRFKQLMEGSQADMNRGTGSSAGARNIPVS